MTAMRIVMLGAPGAGKGTQAQGLSESLGVAHISTGDMLRAAVAAGTPVGLRAREVMEAGQLVGNEIVIEIATERLEQDDSKRGFILDGFPRTSAQAAALDGILAKQDASVEACLALTVDTEEVVGRLLKRAELEGRADDNEETIRERMRVYDAETAPLLDYYREQGCLVEVSGMGTVDGVAARLQEALA
jgi:adenylate kinase